MKAHVVAAIILVSSIGSAWAADISASRPAKAPVAPPPAQYNWTGLYIGGNVGYGWARATITDSVDSISEDLSGVIGGGLVGFNWQSGMFVGGIEADYQWSDQKVSLTVPTIFGIPVTFTDRISAFATVRGRAGVALDNVYIYGTGGYAHFEFKSEISGGGVTVSQTSNQGGWTVGAGIDVAVVGNLIARAEYLYLRSFDKDGVILGVPVTGYVSDNVVRGALMYKFGGGAPVRAAY